AEYVASQLRLAGVEPAGTDGYFQPVPYAVASIDAPRSAMRLHRGTRARTLEWKKDWIAGADVLRERTQVRAPALFAGYGVRAPELGHDDYAGLDVRGKVVVIMLGAPKNFAANPRAYYSSTAVKERAAAEQGAVGIVLLRNAHDASKYPWELIAHNAGRVPSMKWVAADGRAADYSPEIRGSAVLSEGAAAALFEGAPKRHAELLATDAAGEALPRFALPVEIEIEKRGTVSRLASPNVVGVLKGSDPALAAEHVVYSAHLDHLGVGAAVDGDDIYNGAYDNAMGIAMLLETARAFAAMQPRPRRSILFVAVGGEERGLLGSDYFARHPTVPARQLVADVNLDMPLVLFPLADVVAFGSEHSTLGAAAEAAARAEGLRLAPDPVPDEVIFIRSDQYSFVRQGIPSVFLTAGSTSSDPAVDGPAVVQAFRRTHYHKPSDDLSRPVDWAAVATFARMNLRIGAIVAQADAPPAWHAGNFFGEKFGAARAAAGP
ncbi:MAG: M28 family metallopeptidase, partial [Nevskiaceae bacterium]